ncbi:MAG: hypothetical protein IPM68_05770 [Flavobacteriales bacterium]|nr:hypothetical protein [Flavobacteriales bacterium]
MKQLAAAALMGLASTAGAATYHVAVTGNDAHSGLSPADAWATTQHGADVAVAGDTVLVHPGGHQGLRGHDPQRHGGRAHRLPRHRPGGEHHRSVRDTTTWTASTWKASPGWWSKASW